MGRMTSLFYEMENNPFMFETTNHIYIYSITMDIYIIYLLFHSYLCHNNNNNNGCIFIYICNMYTCISILKKIEVRKIPGRIFVIL